MRLSHRALMSGLTGKFKWGRRSRNAKMVRYKGTERGDCSSGAASGTKGGEKSLPPTSPLRLYRSTSYLVY